jgi:hypothetical protein
MAQKTFCIAVVIATIGTLLPLKANAQAADQVQMNPQLQANQARQDAIVNVPFSFYGKVVDPTGQPVGGASAKVTLWGEPGSAKASSERKILSGADGMFSLKDVRAVSIEVVVTKEGYRTMPAKTPPGGWGLNLQDRSFPTAAAPAIFPLQKIGGGEPLVVFHTGGMDVSQDGAVAAFDLASGHKRKDFTGGVQVQTWVDAHDPKSQQPYHWKFSVTMPGGGLQLRTDDYQFVAPSSGYQASDVVDMTPGSGPWSDVSERSYFIKTADGKYGRIQLSVNAHGSFAIEGYLNPSGSQNLEFDPTKRLKPGGQK